MLIDTHCHADLYPDPSDVVRKALTAGIGTVVVTNLPSAFRRAYPFIGRTRGVRLALGLHPLMAQEHRAERQDFMDLLGKTDYVGEVGLDFSQDGLATRAEQVESFRSILRALRDNPKFVTLHSRRAEMAVLEVAAEEGYGRPLVFHWFSGSVRSLGAALAVGHYFSVNPAMTVSPHGRRVIAGLPRDRVLVESDGPFVRIGRRPAVLMCTPNPGHQWVSC